MVTRRIQLLFFFLLSLLFASGLALPTRGNRAVAPYERASAKVNKLFDTLLPTIRNLMINHGLDPMQMDDFTKPLQGLIIRNGVLHMTNGWVQGVSNIIRAGDIIFSYENKLLTMDMDLGFEFLDVNYEYLFKYGLITRTGDFHGRFSSVKLRVILMMDMTTKTVTLDYLKITNMGKLDIKLEGHVIDRLLNATIKGITTVFRKCVMEKIETEFVQTFEHLLKKLNQQIHMPDEVRYSNSPALNDAPAEVAFYLI